MKFVLFPGEQVIKILYGVGLLPIVNSEPLFPLYRRKSAVFS